MDKMSDKKRLIVGMSGASGAPLTIELLKQLKKNPEVETHLIATRGAILTLEHETYVSFDELKGMSDVYYDAENIGERPASGSFCTVGMVVIPCSMKTVAGIASGYSDNLLLRAADVTLKERRKLVLVARETPLSTLHLRNLYEVSKFGAVVMPPVPAYYRHPETMDECSCNFVIRLLDQFNLNAEKDGYEWAGI